MVARRLPRYILAIALPFGVLAIGVVTDTGQASAQSPRTQIGDPATASAETLNADRFSLWPSGRFDLNYNGCGGITAPVQNADYEQEIIELTNEERLDNGALAPLKRRESLVDASRYHSTDMREDDYFNHNTYDRNAGGALVYVCGWATRVSGYYGSYTSIAENIAAGYTTPASVIAAWMGSTAHRANILSTNFWEIGAGYGCCGGTYTRYWGQNFGKKSGVYPLVIDRETATTDTTSVDLYIYGTFAEMRLRNDNGSWGSWQTFSNNVAWTLNNEAGLRTVSVEMRSGSPTYSSSDTIELLVVASATPTSGSTNTPVPPTSTLIPPTNIPTSTNTQVPPTNTSTPTNTSVPPTSTSTPTNTQVPPTSTPTSTNTPTQTNTSVPPTSTSTPTNTQVPPTSTPTSTNTPTQTNTSVPPTSTPTPTNTQVPPTSTPTSTNTPTPTNTSAPPTSMPTPTNTSVPPTSTPTSTNTPVPPTSTPVPPTNTALPPTSTSTPPPLMFISVHDAYVDSAHMQARYGLLNDLAVHEVATSDQNTYIKFDVTGLSGAPTSAVVRVRVTDGSNSGGSIYAVSNTFAGRIQPWIEYGINWVNAPAISGSPLATLGTVTTGTWAEYTVTSAVGGNGTYSFGITSDSTDRAVFNSRQAASNPPELLIQP